MITWKHRLFTFYQLDGSKRLKMVNLTLCHGLCLKNCHPPFWGSFSAICFNSCESIQCHFNTKTLFFKFLWLEFRFKSFLELHVHFKGFVCLRMRKLHAECQIPADAHDWWMPNCVFIECSKIHFKILNDKNTIAVFGVIGQNFGPVYYKYRLPLNPLGQKKKKKKKKKIYI